MANTKKQDENDSIIYELDQYRQQNFNLLVPDIAISGLSIFHKPVIDKVTLSDNPEQGDVYQDNNAGGLVISGKGLAKLATTAGIIWDMDRCRRIDDRSDKNYFAYRAVGGLRKPDGAIVWADASYDLDLDVLREQLIESYTAKARQKEKDQSWIDYCVNRDYQQKRTHASKLTETGSKNRVIRKLLGIKSTYKPKELARPFVMPRIIIQPDYNDPVVKEKMLEAAIASMTGLYGPSPSSPRVPDHPTPRNPPSGIDDPDPSPKDIDPDAPLGGDAETMAAASRRQDFIDSDHENQVKILTELAKRKGYNLAVLKRPMIEWDEKYLVDFYDKLISIPETDRPFD